MIGFGQNGAAFVYLVTVQADNQWFGCGIAEDFQGLHNTVGNLVTRGDTTENVDEYGVNFWVTQDHVEAIGHNLGVRATTDVQEVCWLDGAVVFTGVGDNVQGGHDEACTVTNNANGTFKLHIVEAFGFGFGFQWVFGAFVNEFSVCWLTECSVVIHGHFAVDGYQFAFTGQDQWVDFNQGGIFFFVDFTELDEDVSDLALQFFGVFCLSSNLLGDFTVQTGGRCYFAAGQVFWSLDSEFFNVHTAFYRSHGQVGAVGAV